MREAPLKIVCCGSSGGGKTTLARLLAQRLRLPVIDYSRPTAAAKHLGYQKAAAVPPDIVPALQWFGLHEQFRAEYEATRGWEAYCPWHTNALLDQPKEQLCTCRQFGNFVADRGTLDFAAYHLFQARGARRDDPYVRLAAEHASETYDALILVPPPTWGVEDNTVRYTHGVEEVHRILLDLLDRFDLGKKTVRLRSNTPEERVAEVLAWLG